MKLFGVNVRRAGPFENSPSDRQRVYLRSLRAQGWTDVDPDRLATRAEAWEAIDVAIRRREAGNRLPALQQPAGERSESEGCASGVVLLVLAFVASSLFMRACG